MARLSPQAASARSKKGWQTRKRGGKRYNAANDWQRVIERTPNYEKEILRIQGRLEKKHPGHKINLYGGPNPEKGVIAEAVPNQTVGARKAYSKNEKAKKLGSAGASAVVGGALLTATGVFAKKPALISAGATTAVAGYGATIAHQAANKHELDELRRVERANPSKDLGMQHYSFNNVHSPANAKGSISEIRTSGRAAKKGRKR